ncbi:alpha/beta hydrolase [Hahella sp. CCB-MM4]|uniref:alpha/beta fold hydrolase n=1 Tax=Hahella sp. (strain CCB-MM4) TaxID=1926491 RepID=UPI000B9B05BE|nr:alpha/beta fold hydrolase [Hahella sp. CCB-MM4]OZG72983.1 alpha/beta hydrolase [Hahella sp. CCB-MM4]
MSQSTFILVHAAWLGAWAWHDVAQILVEQGHSVVVPDLPGHGGDNTPAGDIHLKDYVDRIMLEVDRSDGPVVLVGHSFAGIVISQVAEIAGPEKVKGLVYVAAFLLPDGGSFIDAVSGVTDSVAVEHFYLSGDETTAHVAEEKMHEAFAQDVPQEAFIAASQFFVPEPAAPLMEKLSLTGENYRVVPRYYIEATEDKAVPITAQRAMASAGNVRRTFSLNTGHCPNFSQPGKLAEYLQEIHGELNPAR